MNLEPIQKIFAAYPILPNFLLVLGILFGSFFFHILIQKILYTWIEKQVLKTKNTWDDTFLKEGVFRSLSYLAPILIGYYGIRLIPIVSGLLGNLILAYIFMHLTYLIDRLLSSGLAIYDSFPVSKRKPLKGYVQLIKIFLYILGGVISISLLIGQSPLVFLSGIGALTAVLVLVFRDTILSFIASIQIASNDLIRVGDWIEFPSYNADGDVIEVALHTIKIQNWDKTISIIPTHKAIESPFKNWRGMTQAGGRRIKRALYIDLNCIQFCDQKLLEKLSEMYHLQDYLQKTEGIVQEHNNIKKLKEGDISTKKMTNVGIFRAYVESYLKDHPDLRKDMTFLVRQLAPTAEGLPLEIYVFSSDITWVNYEKIQADIFDHFLAILPEFNLCLFQNPTGNDFVHGLNQKFSNKKASNKENG